MYKFVVSFSALTCIYLDVNFKTVFFVCEKDEFFSMFDSSLVRLF